MDPETELLALEPIFHRASPGTTRADFALMIADDFREVGASGTLYGRDEVLDVLEHRYADREYVPMAGLDVDDFACRAISAGIWLVTYRLRQHDRLSRRLTVWRRDGDRWVALYHQGTVIE